MLFLSSFLLNLVNFLGGGIIMEDLLRLKHLLPNLEAVAHLPVQPPIKYKHL
jgi:hypothetical protein